MPHPVSSLVRWYLDTVRRFLETSDPKRVESIDAESVRLQNLEDARSEQVPVCFLGLSGVGKSTLINALVGESLLPHGGIGPLTAQALSVRHGETASFAVRYHPPAHAWRVAFALQQTYLAEMRRQGVSLELPSDPTDLSLFDGIEPGKIAVPDEVQEERNREFRKQAVLMVAGRQDAERQTPYLIDRLREAVGPGTVFGTESTPKTDRELRACALPWREARQVKSASDSKEMKIFASLCASTLRAFWLR